MKKRVFWIRKSVAGLMLLLLLPWAFTAALAQTAAPLLPVGITWDMTPEAVMEAEGTGGADVSDAWSEIGAQYVIPYPAEGGQPEQQVIYRFLEGQLIMYSCTIDGGTLPEGETAAAYYEDRLSRLTAAYGDPTEEETWMTGMLMAMITAGVEDGSVNAYAVWELEDGTLILLEDREVVGVSYTFINGPALFGTAL